MLRRSSTSPAARPTRGGSSSPWSRGWSTANAIFGGAANGPLGILSGAGLSINAGAVDSTRRLKAVYGSLIHGKYCPRYTYYAQRIYASKPGEAGCLKNIGCKGLATMSLCTRHGWNGGQPQNLVGTPLGSVAEGLIKTTAAGNKCGGNCITAGAPCMGCTEKGYPDAFVPFVVALREGKEGLHVANVLRVRIEVDPISRIEGHLGVKVTTNGAANGATVTEADAHGNLWRGFENFLIGRDPNDAITFTQRICGVCPLPHATASTFAVESVLGVSEGYITFATTDQNAEAAKGVPPKAVLIRNLVLRGRVPDVGDHALLPPRGPELRPGPEHPAVDAVLRRHATTTRSCCSRQGTGD